MKIARRLAEKPPLSFAEEQALKKEKDALQDVADEVEIRQGLKNELHDEAAVQERIKGIDKQLERSAEPVTGAERVTLERRAKALKEHLQKRNPTWNEYSRTRPNDGIRYTELVDRIRKNNEDPVYQRQVAEWKGIQRRLDPENPRASDTRYLMRE